LDENPLDKIADWLAQALSASTRRNPLAMALATCSESGTPSVRMVLARGYCRETGHIVFYTNFGSRKAAEIEATGRAAGVLYWEEFGGRQLRVEGPVTRAPDSDADAYFAQRPAGSQLNAWVSRQSQPLADSDSLNSAAEEKAGDLGFDIARLDLTRPARIPRPSHWGGYRLWIERVEFWSEGSGRFHERLLYYRKLELGPTKDGADGDWQLTRLQP
jgi:pyridoxamine 5'-phosphate oxidase